MIKKDRLKIVLVSSTAFYPQHWLSFKEIAQKNNWSAFVITWKKNNRALLHLQKSWLAPNSEFAPDIFELNGADLSENTKSLKERLTFIDPDIIWIQEEPINIYARETLSHYMFSFRRPRIYCAVCENNFARFPLSRRQKLKLKFQWRRLNGILPVAEESLKGIRLVGMPRRVDYLAKAACINNPPENPPDIRNRIPIDLSNKFVVGFCGRIVEEKGWKILIDALANLPEDVICLFAGKGDQEELLINEINKKDFKGRYFYLGLLKENDVYGFYQLLDYLVVPSHTVENGWREQSAGVALECLSMGVPVIGSTNGGIPEIIGEGGLTFPEKDVSALSKVLRKVYEKRELRGVLSRKAKERFISEYSLKSYTERVSDFFKK